MILMILEYVPVQIVLREGKGEKRTKERQELK